MNDVFGTIPWTVKKQENKPNRSDNTEKIPKYNLYVYRV